MRPVGGTGTIALLVDAATGWELLPRFTMNRRVDCCCCCCCSGGLALLPLKELDCSGLAGEADTAAAGETVSSFDKERGPILYV